MSVIFVLYSILSNNFYDHRDLLNDFYISLLYTKETESSEVIHPSDPSLASLLFSL